MNENPQWSDIGLHLSLAVHYNQWREAPWQCVVITDGDEPGRTQAFRLIEQRFFEQIESAVEQWLAADELPTLSHPASYLLALRFATVGHLLMSFDGLFPPPSESVVGETYRRFLLDWWQKYGDVYAVGFSCSEYDAEV
jgi:hypothetical protein